MRPSFKQASIAALAAVALLLGGMGQVRADFVLPTDGTKDFHIFFTSSGTITGTSGFYSTYASFAANQAQLDSQLFADSSSWYALVSTYSDGHTAQSDLPPDNLPIYNTQGQRIADSISALWAGNLQLNDLDYDQNGNVLQTSVWTGSYPDGSESTGLGNPGGHATIGLNYQDIVPGWWMAFDAGQPESLGGSVYVLSGDITLPTSSAPEPSTLTLLGIGCMGLAGYAGLRRRRAAKAAPVA